MMNLPDTTATLLGYRLTERLYTGSKTSVYRGICLAARLEHQRPQPQAVVIKLLNREHPPLNELLQFRNQYTIAKNLESSGIVRYYSLESYRNSYALVMEDFGGISLRDYVQNQRLSLMEFLEIARQLADILRELYHNQIIHKDIKPANILIHPETKQVKLIDFSIASLLPKEAQEIKNPNVLEGTLLYLSPEQTGRMNRGVDYRSDFYSLGVTFYELLTGRLPFQVKDPLDLVYCHLAKFPIPVHELVPEVPLVLSQIVGKLMAKNAEERYQSALGLKYDLETCWQQLKETGEILPFKIAQRDRSSRFLISEKLYGREAEVQMLLEAFERVSQGNTELMLVAGFSGIGKTAVVNEVHKPIVRQKGYFIKGKYDQFQRNIPLSAFVQAFRDLIGQLLSESDIKLQQWKEKILQAVGENGQVIIEVIPELERLIGIQPTVVELSGIAAQNRFNLVFQKFVQVFTSVEHPLVIFLDDLQWADLASLKLLQVLMKDANYLLILGAYRDNEVSPVHPFMLTVSDLEKTGATINTIALKPLSQKHINHLVADTLSCDSTRAQSLTELVYQKAKGNPFFTTQFLKALHEDKFIQLNPDAGYWQCDISQIKVQSLTDDVVEFMAQQLQKLPHKTQQVLQLAACIGAQFDLQTLAIVSEQSEVEAAAALWKALQEGLIVPLKETYKFFQEDTRDTEIAQTIAIPYRFLHDRVQQAAYSLILESEKKATHLKIGQLLLRKTEQSTLDENIFDIVNQLDIGVEFLSERSELTQLAALNLMAGKKAKAATAYEAAVRYLNFSLDLLEADSWQNQYELTLSIYIEAAEAEYLNANFQRLEILVQTVMQCANTLLDKVKVYELQIQSYQAQSAMLKAIDTGLEVLEKLGIDLSSALCDRSMPELPRMEELESIPEMTDLHQLAALRILIALYPPIYIAKPEMILPIILTMVNLSIEGGHSGLAAYGYVLYGMILCGTQGKIEQGYHSGQLALKLLEQFNATSLKAKIYNLYNAHIRLWKEHAKTTLSSYLEGFKSGLETGDLEWASYNSMHYCKNLFWTGELLDSVEQQQSFYLDFMLKNKHEFALGYASIWRQLTLNLQGKSHEPCQLVGDNFHESILVEQWQSTNNYMSLFALYVAKMTLFYSFKHGAEALDYALLATERTEAAVGLITIGVYNFYYSLVLLALYPQAEPRQQQKYMVTVEENQAKLRTWAHLAPQNYQHKYQLVEAEKTRVLGQTLLAMEYYDQGIQGAKDAGYIQEEALGNELAAEFYLSMGREKIAKTYIDEAYYGYLRWGAKAKTDDLEKRYPQLLASIVQRQQYQPLQLNEAHLSTVEQSSSFQQTIQTTCSSSSSISSFLDFASILKASQALSSEIQLEQLLVTLVEVVMKNAGADKSVLILCKDGNLVIEATAVLGGTNKATQSRMLESIPVESSREVPISIINYVFRTQETLVIDRAIAQTSLTSDAYIQKQQPKSLLCTPILNQGKLVGLLYLENHLTAGVFTRDRLQIINLLTAQAAISLENAKLYHQLEEHSYTLEQKVEERTQELKEQATQLEATLQQLYSTQSQLIQSEKMSSLGQLVAGIAHEINNPVNFIYGNLTYTSQYIKSLIELIELYQELYPQTQPEIQTKMEEIDLEFLVTDLPKLLGSMKMGSDRIRQIVDSLRNFSRLDESEIKPVDIHSGIDSTLLILQHRLKITGKYSEIQVIKEYGQLPLINCYASALNQVFMNILSNAIDALQQEQKSGLKLPKKPTIIIQTSLHRSQTLVIRIADNGPGMEKSVLNKIFDPFFTTKSVGSGTGLGLSISYSIIVDQHQGKLSCNSAPGKGAEFLIEIPL